ncbi:hypothetical protein VNO80_30539 [Phaseolus coccineus]|uniref:C2 domain-containing protein n=1 Tax=Phaseolus coccineus TaxID=3886 RepID=A0AAN9LCZ0_PHACN
MLPWRSKVCDGKCGWVLRVGVKRGVNLAVRNFRSRSSYPYVVIKILNQTLKTRFIRKNVNPEWNEDFTLSNIDPNHPLKLIVYDPHLFFMDKMGDAEFDIFPFVEALKTNLTAIPNVTVIKRIQPSKHNFLAHESCITYVIGKLVQDMILRLQNVKCGQLEIQLHWVDLPIMNLKIFNEHISTAANPLTEFQKMLLWEATGILNITCLSFTNSILNHGGLKYLHSRFPAVAFQKRETPHLSEFF